VEVREDIRKKEDEERATRNECDMWRLLVNKTLVYRDVV
jgi:hypothetical protein